MSEEFLTPQVDAFVERYGDSSAHNMCERYYESEELSKLLHKFIQILKVIKPVMDGQDEVWSFWIRSKRGPIFVFADDDEYEEMLDSGEIQSMQDLELIWQDYYPEEINWHSVSFRIYDKIFFFSFDAKPIIQLNLKTDQVSAGLYVEDAIREFLSWVLSKIEAEIENAQKDIDSYNNYISNNLPLHKRYGKIKRMLLWENISGIERLDYLFGKINLERFGVVVASINKDATMPEMTADKFFQYCQLCYDANDYFQDTKMIAVRNKYKKMADGRDEGLLDIEGDSSKAFEQWYLDKTIRGGHPWEICRGGNSTHISLIVHKGKGGWQLYLAGSSRARVVETARMAIALFDNNIPFILTEAQGMLHMLEGSDYCGIVPKSMVPKYCHSCFPEEDKIIDFINPWHDKEIIGVIEKYATWYPLDKLELA